MADPRGTHDHQPPPIINSSQDGDSIYIGNLPYDTRTEELVQLCNNYGRVLSVSIAEERESKKPRGFAFVKLASPEEAEVAVKALAGSNFGGRPLRAKIAIDSKRDQALAGGGGGKVPRSHTPPPSTRGPYGGPPRDDPYGGGGGYNSSSRGPPPRYDRPYDREMDKYSYDPPGYSMPRDRGVSPYGDRGGYRGGGGYDQDPYHPYDRDGPRGREPSYRGDVRGYHPSY